MPPGVIARLVGGVVFVLAIIGGALYFTHLGSKLEKQEVLLKRQAADLELRAQNEKKLIEALDDQSEATNAAKTAATVANELYEEALNRPRPTRIVPRETIREVIRPGDCDRAAVDAWDLLQQKGVMTWSTTSSAPSAEYWRDYYLDYARHAQPPRPVQVDFHVSRPLTPGLTGLRYQPLGPSLSPCPMFNSGLQVSAEIRWPTTDQP